MSVATKLSLLLCAAAFTLVAPVAHAIPWTIATSGTITTGDDPLGLVGGGSLAGKAFSMQVTIDPDLNPLITTDPPYAIQSEGSGPSFTTTVTVDGLSFSSVSSTAGAGFGNFQYLASYLSQGLPLFDAAATTDFGETGADVVVALQSVSSASNMFIPAADFTQVIDYSLQAGDSGEAGWYYYRGADVSYFSAVYDSQVPGSGVQRLQVNNTPEPTVLSLIGLGLLAFGWRVGRKKLA